MKTLFLPTHCDADFFDDAGYNIVRVDMTPSVIARLLALREACKELLATSNCYCVSFWDSSFVTVAYPDDVLGEAFVDKVDNNEIAVVGGVITTEDGGRTECDMVRVKSDGIYWHFYPKHTSVHIETETVPWSTIEQLYQENLTHATT